jgi:AcrR family transcriptional regulator
MPKLKPATQTARRQHILDSAARCFARSGFHRTTMQDICREAAISPGAIYVYFDSKEALIAGLCERDRADFAVRFQALSEAPDTLDALRQLGEHYFVEEAAHKRLLAVEIGVEATRNARVGEIFGSVDGHCRASFQQLFQRLKDEGRINPQLEIETLAKVFMIIGDGMFWRRAIDPQFDAKAILPAILDLIGHLMAPTGAAGPEPIQPAATNAEANKS